LRVAVANGRGFLHPRLVRAVGGFVGRGLLIDARVDRGAGPKRVHRVSLRCAQSVDLVDACSARGAETVGRGDRRDVRAGAGIDGGAAAVGRRCSAVLRRRRSRVVAGGRAAIVVGTPGVVVCRDAIVRRRAAASGATGRSDQNERCDETKLEKRARESHSRSVARESHKSPYFSAVVLAEANQRAPGQKTDASSTVRAKK
jgi:hypothetical protein